MKFKECDAAKSIDEFNVGDKINFYNNGVEMTNWCIESMNEKLVILKGRVNETPIHYKQCRKLIEEKPREVWMHEMPDGKLGMVIFDSADEVRRTVSSNAKAIRFVEAEE